MICTTLSLDSFFSDHVQNVIVKIRGADSIQLEWSAPKKGEVSFFKVTLGNCICSLLN